MSGSNEHGTLHEWPSNSKKQNLKHTFKLVSPVAIIDVMDVVISFVICIGHRVV